MNDASHASLAELMDAYCAVWNHADPAERQRRLAPIWAEGGIYTDPRVHAVGAQALLEHIGRIVAQRPGARVVRTSAVDTHHGLLRFAWRVIQADGSALPEGIDFVELAEDGRIRRIVGFYGPLPALGAG